MAAAEIYDYVSAASADYDYTLTIAAQSQIIEDGEKNQRAHLGDDGSVEIITLSSTSIFYAMFSYQALSESDAGTIFDLYHDPVKAGGMARTFKWTHPTDGHTYVVRFWSKIPRTKELAAIWGFNQVILKIEGKI